MITCNGKNVLSGTLTLSLIGNWTTLNLSLDTADADSFAGGTSVTITDGVTSFNGIVAPDQVGLLVDSTHLTVIGGKGGLGKKPTPKQFSSCLLRDVVLALMNDSGESLSSTVNQSLLNTTIGTWTIFSDSVSNALEQVLEQVNPLINWRILPDGSLWFGIETWDGLVSNAIWIDRKDKEQAVSTKKYVLGVTGFDFETGISITTSNLNIPTVCQVIYNITPTVFEASVFSQIDSEPNFLLQHLNKLIDKRLDYLKFSGLYVGTVVTQSSDLSKVDIRTTDSNVPSMSSVPLLNGSYIVLSGQKVLYGWSGMNPSIPFAIGFPSNASTKFVALDGDQSDCGSLTFAGSGTLTYFPPGAPTPGAVLLKGKIASSATKIKGN